MAVKMAKKDDQEQRQAEKTEISLAEEKGVSTIALNFTPEDGKHLHPQAREKIQWLFNFFSQYFSSENWLKPLQFYLANIDDKGLLWVSTDIAQAAQPFYDLDLQNNDIQLAALLCRLDSDINDIKIKWIHLMKKAIDPYYAEVFRQTKKAEAERRQKEAEGRWAAALKAVNPPYDDANRYLPSGVKDRFIKAARVAVEVYLEKGEGYKDDSRTWDYRSFCRTIKEEEWTIKCRREEKEREAVAERKSWEFNRLLSEEIARLRSILLLEKQNPEGYFEKMIADLVDLRYSGQSFVHLLSPDVKQSLHTDIARVARVKMNKLLPEPFSQFTDWEYWISYFLLPWADYRLKGVPCLDFSFEVFAVVEIKVWLKLDKKSFDGYMFPLPQIEHKVKMDRDTWTSYFAPLEEPELLGYHYLVLTPSEIDGYVAWKSIPSVLLKGLLNGEENPAGTTPLVVKDGMTTYKILGFKGEIEIPDSFASYLKEIGNIDTMLTLGIVIEKVASLAESTEVLNLPRQVEDKGIKKQASKLSKKDQLELLFDELKRPSAAEVKNLGIKPNTVYRYYQAWKKAHNIS